MNTVPRAVSRVAEAMVGTVAIVGAGRMGVGIAEAFLLGGDYRVVLADRTPTTAHAGHDRLAAQLQAHADAGLIGGDKVGLAARAEAADDIASAVAHASLVIEAVVEELDVKLEVLRACDASAPGDAIIATNTSSLSVDTLAAALARPERFLGTHWFNPPEWTPAVEVVVGQATAPELADRVVRLLRGVGKRPCLVADSVGFIANRLQMALFCEAARCVDEGLATVEGLDEIVRSSFGFRLPFYGPFQIADMAGLEIYEVVAQQHHDAFGERFSVPPSLRARVAAGRFGARVGAGFYTYDEGAAERLLRQRDRFYAALRDLLGRACAEEFPAAPRRDDD